MILILDNYGAFTDNLAYLLKNAGEKVEIRSEDNCSLSDINKLLPKAIVITSGLREKSITPEVIRKLAPLLPILGIGLGHQAINLSYGAKLKTNSVIMHGKISNIYHDGKGVYGNLPNPLAVTRYDRSIIDRSSLPTYLIPVACDEKGELMGVRHLFYPVETIQFHPESIMTCLGEEIINNFLLFTRRVQEKSALLRFNG